MFSIIAAYQASDRGIGKDGKLPWVIPSDLKRFREITCTTQDESKRNAVIMGRATWESLSKKPLKSRINIVITSSLKTPDAFSFPSLDAALDFVKEESDIIENAFVIGGERLYREAISHPFFYRAFLTEVNASEECDRFLSEIPDNFRCVSISQPLEENGTSFAFHVYQKI